MQYLNGSFLQFDSIGEKFRDISKGIMGEHRKKVLRERQDSGVDFGMMLRRPQWNGSTNHRSKNEADSARPGASLRELAIGAGAGQQQRRLQTDFDW